MPIDSGRLRKRALDSPWAVALLLVALGAASGCKRDAATGDEAAQATDPANQAQQNEQPVSKEEAEAAAKNPEPPADKDDAPAGAAPSADHFWVHGHWQWNSRTWVWVPGRWEYRVAPSAPPPIKVEVHGRAPTSRHVWVSGHWRWDGGRWLWVGGHWDSSRYGKTYAQGHWERVSGRYVWAPGHWVR